MEAGKMKNAGFQLSTRPGQIFRRLGEEVGQSHQMRVQHYENINQKLGGDSVVVAFFASFIWEAPILDSDADMLEEVLQNTNLEGKRLALMLNSPGGDGLAAERIINICRSYSPSGFCVIVPKMAKSAATMICLGSNEILMSNTSELGPIDPQIAIHDDNGLFIGYQAAHELIESYEELLRKASSSKGRLEPYLQQLARFDARNMRRIVSAQELTARIAVKSLKTGIFKNFSETKIRAKIKPFLDPNFTTDHGRPIYHDVATSCGLNVTLHENKNEIWREIWQLYARLNYLTSSHVLKVIESGTDSYTAHVPRRDH